MSKSEIKSASRSKGRPRDDKAHQLILRASLDELLEAGFRALSMDRIAARSGVGKMTIYRRWPNKAALVMDAFLKLVGPETEFPQANKVCLRIRKQLSLQAKFFRGKYGQVVRALIGEAQFDSELAKAFHDQWLKPRRIMTQEILKQGITQKEFTIKNLETSTDALYAPFYYRLLLKSGKLDEKFVTEVYKNWLRSAREEKSGTRFQ